MPIDLRRRDDIAAAVAAYDRDHPDAPLPRNAGRLLAVMFRQRTCATGAWRTSSLKGSVGTDFLRRYGGWRRPSSCHGNGVRLGSPIPTTSTCRRWCSHEEPPPREGVRPRPRCAAGPQRQGPHCRLQPRLGPPAPPPGQRGGALGRAALDVLGALLWVFHNARSGAHSVTGSGDGRRLKRSCVSAGD